MSTHPIRFGLATGQQNHRWDELAAIWEAADQAGYDSLWTGDHLYAILTNPADPAFEGWTALAALSQRTSRARIGSLVNCNGFRNPCLTAKMTATVDHASNGRFILGLGAGWFELEHRSLGFEFKPIAQRLEALEEACTIITSMLERGKASFRGRHYAVAEAICSPRAVQIPRPPLMIAGQGEKVLLGIVARHADLWNAQGSPDRFRHLIDRLRGHCDRIGRDPDAIEKSVAISLCYRQGREREEEALHFAAMLGRTSPEEARRQMMIGSREECLDRIEKYRAAGVTHFILVSGGRFQIDEIRAFAAEVIPAVRA